MSRGDAAVPVFVFPTSLEYYKTDRATHKQVLTVYNPYDFPIQFKVYCTAPTKYNIVEPDGIIRPLCRVDIVIRHTRMLSTNEGVIDKFRINIYKQGSNRILGRKDIKAKILLSKREKTPFGDEEFLPSRQSAPGANRPAYSDSTSSADIDKAEPKGPDLLIIFIALVCITILFMPETSGEESSFVSNYITMHHQYKLMAAFVLGMVTTVILRS